MKEVKKKFAKRLWNLLAGYRLNIGGVVFLIMLIQLFTVSTYFVIKKIIDSIVMIGRQEVVFSHFYPYLAIFIIANLLIRIVYYLQNRIGERLEINLEFSLMQQAVKKVFGLPMQYHEKHHTGTKMEKIQRGVWDVIRLIELSFWQFLPTIFMFFAYSAYLFFLNWQLAAVFCLVIPIFIFLTYFLSKKSFKIKTKVRRQKEKLFGSISESIYSIKTVKSFVQESRQEKNIRQQYSIMKKLYYRWIDLYCRYDSVRGSINIMGMILLVIWGTWLVFHGQLTAGSLVLFITMGEQIISSLWQMTHVFDSVIDASVGVNRLVELFQEKNSIVINDNAIKHEVGGKVEFQQVSFSYEKEAVIKNFNLKINAGDVVAFVGPSGGGKTTIIKLIYRYFDVDTGTILIDGENLKNLDLDYYRLQLGQVNQDIDIFNDTVKANIAYGRPQAKLQDIKKAARIANAEEFIRGMKKKYDTLVGERGVKLSGGQRQRIGIARAVLVDPKILILDEATSFLDAEFEAKIQQAIARVIKNRTTIIIAHRLSTIKHADKIVFIDNGRIKEQGTHEQLLRKKGAYAKLIKLQTQGYL